MIDPISVPSSLVTSPFAIARDLLRHWLDGPERKLRIRKLELEIQRLDRSEIRTDPQAVIDAVAQLVHEIAGLRLAPSLQGPVIIRDRAEIEIPHAESGGVPALTWTEPNATAPARRNALEAMAERVARRREADAR